MIPRKNEDRPLLYKRNSSNESKTGESDRLADPTQKETPALGRWVDGQFKFFSPETQTQWHRDAYRQGVHREDWHKGDPVDPQTLQLVQAGVAGKTPPYFHGPDGQHRFSNFQTIEPAEVRAIRARNFAGKTLEQVSAVTMPGEDEAVQHAGTIKGSTQSIARVGPTESASYFGADPAAAPLQNSATSAPVRANVGIGAAIKERQPAEFGPILLADASAVPMLPKGMETVAPRPMGGVEPLNAGGKVPNFKLSPANDNMKPAAVWESNEPRVPDRQSTFSPTAPAGSIPTTPSSTQSPLNERKNDIDQAVRTAVGEDHERWAQEVMADPRAKDPAFVAEKATQLITFDLPYAIDAYRNLPNRDVYQTLTPLDIELLRGGYTQRIVDLLPEQYRPQVQKELDARPKILTSGPAGLGDLLAAREQGELVAIEVDGSAIPTESVTPNPYGTKGGPQIREFNQIVLEEATSLVKACIEPDSVVEHVGGVEKTEYWIQDFMKSWTQKGGKRIDITLKFKIKGEDCLFHINTADTAVKRLFDTREWGNIKASAGMMSKHGASSAEIDRYWTDKLGEKIISKFNAFFMVPKPDADKRSPEEMRDLARKSLGVLSCSEIELACRNNLILNVDPFANLQ